MKPIQHALLAVFLGTATLSFADTEVVDGITWTYTLSNGEASIGGGSSSSTAVPTETPGAVTIPSSLGGCPVTSIGSSAFRGCSGLTSITIPDSVTSIGSSAFYGCSGLTSITIPDGVTSIGDYAFLGCSGLTSVMIGNSVTSIGDRAFYGCSGLTSITIPDGVTRIGGYAFYGCSGLTSITIPDGVTSIGGFAFFGCSGLTSLVIPNSVASIGDAAFRGCSGLTSITIPDGVTSIGGYAFYGCSGLTSITIPDSVTSIGDDAFYGCSRLMSITIPNSVTNIGYAAFEYCCNLASATIPDGVTSIQSFAFSGCSGLVSVVIGNDVTSIGSYTFSGCSGLVSVVIGNDVTSIGSYTFYGCPRLVSVVIGNGVTSIGYRAFYLCSALASVTIPDSVTSIEQDAFYGCSGLQEVILGNGVSSLNGFSFSWNMNLATVVIGNGVTSIGNNAFSGCSSLMSITIPNSVASIGDAAFYNCSGLTSITIPDGVTSIGGGAFSGCSGLTSLTIPDGVTRIQYGSFDGCSGLTSITIPDSVTSIGDYAFRWCSGLTSITIPDSVTSIGNEAFSSCSGLTSITIPDSVTSIGKYAFYDCSGLASVTIPDSVTSIGNYAFYDCSGLASVTIPDSVTSVGEDAFYGCSGLTSITIPDSVTSIGDDAFYGCSRLTTLYLPNSYSETTPYVPSGCTIVRYDKAVSFSVSSPFGAPVPGCGTGIAPSNVLFSCSVSSPVEADGWSYVCTGWRGTGSVPASGTSNRVDVLMLEDSSIEWWWETNVWIECEVTGDAAPSGPGSGWFRKDGPAAVFSFVPSVRPFLFSLSGDTNGVSVNAEAGTVSIPTDCPHMVELHVLTRGEAGESGTGKPLPWSDGADAPWSVMEDNSRADGFCLQSGEVNQGGTSALETTVTGPGRLSFAWRFDAGRNDFVRFYVDGAQQAQITRGSTTWATNEVDLAAGQHVLRWMFERGSAAGGAGFLDDVRWMPLHALMVASAAGTPTPAVGTHDVYWGTEVVASVAAPAPVGGTRRVCTGWTGTGSVPAGGTETNVSFTVEADSTLTWNWRTDHWIDIAVSSGGSTSFQPQWAAEGSTVSASLSPNWSLYDIALSGDTNGVTVSGSTLRVPADGPRTIRATITERKVSFTVSTPMGEVSPAPGTHVHSYGDTVTAAAVSPLREANGEQVVCAGWTGTGSVPASGTGSSASFRIYRDSSIAWTWATNVWIDVTVSGGSTPFSPQWVRKGTIDEIELTPAMHLFSITLSGDVSDGVELVGTTLRVLADRPRTIRAVIEERTISLAVSSAFGTASPAVGTHVRSWGDWVEASVAAPGPDGGTNRVCTGWTGTGSVPATGGTATAFFTMEEDSSLAWNWRTDYRISLETDGPVAADFSDGWCASGGTLEIAYDVLLVDGDFTFALGGDTNGVVHDAAARTLAVPCDGARVLSLAVAPVPPDPPEPETTLESALDAPGLVWTSEGANAWTPQLVTAKDGVDAAESGDAAGGTGFESILSTTVIGPGTFSWSWRVETAGDSGIDLEIDGELKDSVYSDEADAWIDKSVAIAGEGTHEVRFVFWNEGIEAADRGVVDCVSWSGVVPAAPGSETTTTPEPVPHDWLVLHGLATAGSSAAAFEAAAEQRGGNGRPAWESYVAGIDPDTEDFTVSIDCSRGFPEVTWSPSNVAGRAYAVWGKAALSDQWTTPTNETHRFFQVRVGLAGTEPDDSFDEPVVVTFDPAGGTVDPATKTYAKPGALGALPVPVRDGRDFLGWWTRETGGVQVDETTAVPWSNWTLVATWRLRDPLVAALNPELVFTKGGDGEWFPQGDDTHDGESAARSGAITHNQSTWIETPVTGPGTVNFWWKVSSESGCDCLQFYVDGSQQESVSGTGGDWTQKTVAVSGTGTHTLRWTYSKDGSVNSGSDCGWVDEVVWTPDIYTLRFDANGGSGTMTDAADIAAGTAVTLPTCGFTRNGWTFVGWSTAADGAVEWAAGETVADGLSGLAEDGVSTLYARWSRGAYTIRFDANGGTGTMPDATLWTDIPQTLPQNAFAKDGMSFGGWTTNGVDSVVWSDGASVENLVQPGGTATLKAVWIEKRGLDVLYYDISSSVALGYTESEMASYFAGLTPTIETNSLAFGETLDPGISNVDNKDYSEFVDFGYTGLRFSSYETTTRFHGVYGSMNRNNFCVFATGTINVETSGTYRFGAVADDRFVLFIDGVRVLYVNWGQVAGGNPASGTGSIDLSAGSHTLSIGFSEGSGGEGFFVQWKRPGDSTWSPLPQSILGGSN